MFGLLLLFGSQAPTRGIPWAPRHFPPRHFPPRHFPGVVRRGLSRSCLLLFGDDAGELPYDLLEAAVLWLRADSAAVAACPGGFHSGLTPAEDARLGTYCQIKEVGETESRQSAGTVNADGLLQLSIFSISRASVKRARDIIRTSLNDAHLVFQTGQILRFRPIGPNLILDPSDPTIGGSNLFHAILQITYSTTSDP